MSPELRIPNGFEPHFKKSKFTDPWEPLYSQRLPDRVQIGLHLSEAHCNSRGFVHGGLIAALADNAMGLSCVEVIRSLGHDISGLLTISLQTDYLSAAQLGEWLMVDTDFTKCGKTICFARCLITGDNSVVAKANASFKVVNIR